VSWKEYPMAHEVVLEEIQDIGTWLKQLLKA
jgi:predicted esterase